jgi:ankyrin repeat protein
MSLNKEFLIAATRDDLNAVKDYLAQGADINAEDTGGDSALHHAVYMQNMDMARFLLSKGIDKEHQSHFGWTPLIAAASYKQPGMVEFLLEQGANPDAQVPNGGWSALYYAVQEKNIEVLKVLLKAPLNINATNTSQETPLMHAAWAAGEKEDRLPVVKALLEAGADPNTKDKRGNTALMHAVFQHQDFPGIVDVMRALIDAGADIDTKNNDGKTAADYTEERGFGNASDFLKNEKEARELAQLQAEQRAREVALSAFRNGLPHAIKAPKTLRFKP